MINSRHYYKGTQVEEPVNWEDLEITMEWAKGKIDATINLDNLLFKGEVATKIIKDLEENGYYNGREYRVEVGELLDPAMTFEGYLDPSNDPLIKACNIIEIPLKRKQGEDWLVERAEGVVFRFLASEGYNGDGKITEADYSGIPYIVNFQDAAELLILSLSAFMLAKELVESIKAIAAQTKDLIAGVTPVQGTAGPIPVIAFSIGQIIGAIINLGITVAYTIGIIVGIVKLVEQIIEHLAPPKRFHLGIPQRLLAQRACEALGLTLKSTLLDSMDTGSNRYVIIPSKSHKGGSPPEGTPIGEFTELGVPNAQDGLDNFGQYINFLKKTYNADYQIKDGIFEFERRDFWKRNASYIIPDTFNNQEDLQNENTKNTSELISNYLIIWDDDLRDANTINNQGGRTYQAITSPSVVNDPDLVLTKNSERISIPLSMALRKDSLTPFEEVLKVFLQAADFLSGTLGNSQSFSSQFSARVGSMLIEHHTTTRPKMVVMAGGQLAMKQRSILSAKRLWENFHFIESFVTINDKNNQQKIFKEQKIPFCIADLVSLLNNNFCNTQSGQEAEIITLVYSVEKGSAIVTYRVFEVYDTKLEIKFLDK